MTALNFPTPSQVGEFYTSDGKTWQWSGTAWKAYGTAAPGPTGPTGPGGTGGSGGSLSPWSVKTANYTLVSGDRIVADTTLDSFTLTLPVEPTTGDSIQVTDGADWSVNNLTIARNGSTIEGNQDDLLLDISNVMVELVYDGSTWQIITSVGSQGATGATGPSVTGPTGAGYVNIPQSGSDKTDSYTLDTADIGKMIVVGTGGSITVPNNTFSTGDAIAIVNNTSGNITLTMSITTAYIAGTNTDKDTITLATRGLANVLFLSGTVCIVTGNIS